MVVTKLIREDKNLIEILDSYIDLNQFNEFNNIKINKKSIKILEEPIFKPISRNQSLIGSAYDYMLRFELNNIYKIQAWNSFIKDTLFYKFSNLSKKTLVINGFFTSKDYKQLQYIYNSIFEFLKNGKTIESYILMAKIDNIYRSGNVSSIYNRYSKKDIEDLKNLKKSIEYFKNLNIECIEFNPQFNYETIEGDGDFIINNKLVDIKVSQDNKIPIVYFRQLLLYNILNCLNNKKPFKELSIFNPRYLKEFTLNIDNKDFSRLIDYLQDNYLNNNIIDI